MNIFKTYTTCYNRSFYFILVTTIEIINITNKMKPTNQKI